jgi:hypothetical protein
VFESLNAGVREDDIHAAPLPRDSVSCGANLINPALIGDVLYPPATRGRHEPVRLTQVANGSRPVVEDVAYWSRDVDTGHIRAGSAECDGGCPADPASRTGHYGDSTGQRPGTHDSLIMFSVPQGMVVDQSWLHGGFVGSTSNRSTG